MLLLIAEHSTCLCCCYSCFISDPGVFFGALLTPILLIMVSNVIIFVCASYVIVKLKLKQEEMKRASKRGDKEHRMSPRVASKLIASLVGFMVLLGIPWIIFIFTSVGTGTNVHAAFVFQWLFVFFNSLQGFFICIFFVIISSDAQKEWAKLLAPCWFKRKNWSSFKYRRPVASNYSINTYSRDNKLTQSTNCDKGLALTSTSSSVKDDGQNSKVEPTSFSVKDDGQNSKVEPRVSNASASNQESDIHETSLTKKQLKVQGKLSMKENHDIETGEVNFGRDDSNDEDTS